VKETAEDETEEARGISVSNTNPYPLLEFWSAVLEHFKKAGRADGPLLK
jgi:hypothetical protein